MAGFVKSLLNFGKQSCTFLSNELTEEIEQREMTRSLRDYIVQKSALVDCAQEEEKLNKALSRISTTEEQLLGRIATFQAAAKKVN